LLVLHCVWDFSKSAAALTLHLGKDIMEGYSSDNYLGVSFTSRRHLKFELD